MKKFKKHLTFKKETISNLSLENIKGGRPGLVPTSNETDDSCYTFCADCIPDSNDPGQYCPNTNETWCVSFANGGC